MRMAAETRISRVQAAFCFALAANGGSGGPQRSIAIPGWRSALGRSQHGGQLPSF